jgi:carboxypeptidase C (cathepsin A)
MLLGAHHSTLFSKEKLVPGKVFLTWLVVAAASVCQMGASLADDRKAAAPAPASQQTAESSAEGGSKSSPEEKLSVTRHSIKIGGETLNYTATAGYLRLKDQTGKPRADMFFIAYTKDLQEGSLKRPLTFAFNGGPGAASVWLNLGAMGPKRVATPDPDKPLPPPYKSVDNEYTWLTFSDLVFIDPIGTGLSRPVAGEDAKQFYGINEDLQSVGSFIRVYTTRFDRWLSPKFIAGESYGAFRAVGLSQKLFENYGMDINGIVLISLALNFQTFSFELGNDLPYAMFLPTYTASAWYHKKLPSDLLRAGLHKTLEEAEKWALDVYLPALARGDSLAGGEREKVVESLIRYTGLSKTYIENHDLRIDRSDFMYELLREENRIVGLMDSTAVSVAQRYGNIVNEPGLTVAIGPYMAVMNDTLRNELEYESDLPYVFLSSEAFSQWNWGSAIEGYVSILETLKRAINRSEHLKVFAASGYYDLDVPYLGAKHSLDHLGLSPALQRNITIRAYESGHQLYTNEASLKQLTSDVAVFF